ncbi:MAG: ABC transporter ATP-binding protein [Bacteroidota bacterium]
MQISLDNAGKKFGNQWIFRNINHVFEEKTINSVLGKNGSGKSSLLKIISGYTNLSRGKVSYSLNSKNICGKSIYMHTSIASPHLQLIEELTLYETLNFHFKLKTAINNYNTKNIIEILQLESAANKILKNFSSGMKQRVKLALAFFTTSNLLLLDEPCTNLDKEAKKWYQDILNKTSNSRTVIVFSNHNETETFLSTNSLLLKNNFLSA